MCMECVDISSIQTAWEIRSRSIKKLDLITGRVIDETAIFQVSFYFLVWKDILLLFVFLV